MALRIKSPSRPSTILKLRMYFIMIAHTINLRMSQKLRPLIQSLAKTKPNQKPKENQRSSTDSIWPAKLEKILSYPLHKKISICMTHQVRTCPYMQGEARKYVFLLL